MNTLPSPNDVNNEREVNLNDLIARGREMLAKRLWWFVVTVVAVLGTTWLVTKYQVRIYQATGTLVIERAPPRVLSGVREVVSLGAQGYWGTRQYYEAQRQILQSREVAQMVVDRHGLATDPHLFGLDKPDQNLTETKKRDIMSRLDPAAILASRVVVVLQEDSMIARISIEDSEPEYAQQLVNWVMAAYRERNVYIRRRATREAYKDLKVIAAEMQQRKRKSETALLNLETKYDLSENHHKAIAQRIFSLDRLLGEAQHRRLLATQLVRKLHKYAKRSDMFDVVDSRVLGDQVTQLIKRRLLELGVKKRALEGTYLSKHPKVRAVEVQLQHLRKTAKKHVRGLLNAAQSDQTAAKETVMALQQRLKQSYSEDTALRKAVLLYDQLKTKRDEDRRLYSMVAKRLAETDLTNQVDVNNITVLDEAMLPTVPIRPLKRLNYALGCVLALLCGFGAVLGAELLDSTVKDREQIEKVLGIPYLGAIPQYRPEDNETEEEVPLEHIDLYAHYRPKSRVAEASRSIRTNLLFMRPSQRLHSMVITSAHPREGKTSTSATIAIAMANSSGSCVLVDTDLRKPRLHKVFNVSAESRVTN
ncbi:MAG TPA: hypothetical protein DCQ06_00500, partial [Myxococcales bacterium]|nr:hypothetical protein [Myxococcales bacterium]